MNNLYSVTFKFQGKTIKGQIEEAGELEAGDAVFNSMDIHIEEAI